MLEVWNKADLLEAPARTRIENEARRAEGGVVLVSAMTGDGLDALMIEIEKRLNRAATPSRLRSSRRRDRSPTGSTRTARWCSAPTSARAMTALRIRIAPEKRHLLLRLAGPARLKLAAE